MNLPTGPLFLYYDDMPVSELMKLQKALPKDSVICPRTARLAGASLAAGTPNALEALAKRLEPFVLQKTRLENPDLNEEEINWIATGNRGLSSETLFSHTVKPLSDTPLDKVTAHPHDGADWKRCMDLCYAVPKVRNNFNVMKGVSGPWKRLVENRSELERLLFDIEDAKDEEERKQLNGILNQRISSLVKGS